MSGIAEQIFKNANSSKRTELREVDGVYIPVPKDCTLTLKQVCELYDKYGEKWYEVADEYLKYANERIRNAN